MEIPKSLQLRSLHRILERGRQRLSLAAILAVLLPVQLVSGSVTLTPINSGTEGVVQFTSTLLIDGSGNVIDASGKEFLVAGSFAEPASFNSYVNLTVNGAALVETTAGTSYGAIAKRGEIDKDSLGRIGIRDSVSNGIGALEGVNFGIDAKHLDPALRIRITSLIVMFVEKDETGEIVNRNDTSQSITFDRVDANNGTDIEVDREATIDVTSLDLYVNGGLADVDLATIFYTNTANDGTWRFIGLELDVESHAETLAPGNPNAWRSTLFPDDWSYSLENSDFYTDKLIQDFSHAGYRHGDVPIPDVQGPVFDITEATYGADPSGATDSTVAIRSAIEAAEAAGGGVVFMPAGSYRLSLPDGENTVLRMDQSNVVLRGAGVDQTFLFNTTTNMLGKTVIWVKGNDSGDFLADLSPSSSVTVDLLGPAQRIPVADASLFAAGDEVVFRSDVTDAWINEHNEPGWLGFGSSFKFAYVREVLAVDTVSNSLVLNAPTRYSQFLRENPRIHTLGSVIREVGLEDFSIGNVQHPGTTGWSNSDYTIDGTSAWDVSESYLIKYRHVRNGWIRRVSSYQPTGNTLAVHMLSNGLRVLKSSAVTVEDVSMQRVQYGGGGGNGYNFRFQDACDVLVTGSTAGYNRHGLVFSHMGTSGTVLHNCFDQETRWAASMANQEAGSASSDHHMHFSHSNLVDVSGAQNSFFQAAYRPFGLDPMHNITGAHTVYWNTENNGSRYIQPVETQQARYGYAIGTRGANTSVNTVGSRPQTDPIDHVEGEAIGDNLDPFSLYLDQLGQRQNEVRLHITSDRSTSFPTNTMAIRIFPEIGSNLGIAPANLVYDHEVVSAPATPIISEDAQADFRITVPSPGNYQIRLNARLGPGGPVVGSQVTEFDFSYHGRTSSGPITYTAITLTPTADSFVRRDDLNNYGTEDILRAKLITQENGRAALLRFDVSQISVADIANSRTTLSLEKIGGDGTYDAVVHAGDGGNWTETGVNWSNYPTFNNVVANWSGDAASGSVSIPVDPILQRVDQDDSLTLRLEVLAQSASGPVYNFNSREFTDSALRPRLVIEVPDTETYDDWVTNQGIAAQDSAFSKILTPGGTTNLNSFLGGIDPQAPSGPLPDVALENAQVRFQIPWRADIGVNAFFSPEWSPNLSEWFPLGIESWSTTDLGNQRTLYEVSIPMAVPSMDKIFYRLRTEAEVSE